MIHPDSARYGLKLAAKISIEVLAVIGIFCLPPAWWLFFAICFGILAAYGALWHKDSREP